ncbi:hypothetical protein AB5J62_07525 [Amycolatopsis sp. cg5]|uniref:hypothetical protein n=1 Tax=Amycolatopsis sp. cg5 TaxID=3238802 RepID=UPI0035244D8B
MKKKIAAAAVLGALASTIAVAQPASAGIDPRYYYESSHPTPEDCTITGRWGQQNGLWSKFFCTSEYNPYGWDLYIKK